jgi:hypothetical protein
MWVVNFGIKQKSVYASNSVKTSFKYSQERVNNTPCCRDRHGFQVGYVCQSILEAAPKTDSGSGLGARGG